ncbi:MAG: hypothetical protein ACXWP5_01875 [Bdellovibrionota bacterium]
MKISFIALVCGLVLASANEARSAGVESHGGAAVVCRSEDGKVISAETLDLFEARYEYHRQLLEKDDLTSNLLGKVEKRLSLKPCRSNPFPKADSEFHTALSEINKSVVQLSTGIGLISVEDAFPVIFQKGCKLEQAAVYHSDTGTTGKVLIDAEIYQAFSNIEKAALLSHEALYKLARDRDPNLNNSSAVRKLVGLLFAENSDEEIRNEIYSMKLDLTNDQVATQNYLWKDLNLLSNPVFEAADSHFGVLTFAPILASTSDDGEPQEFSSDGTILAAAWSAIGGNEQVYERPDFVWSCSKSSLSCVPMKAPDSCICRLDLMSPIETSLGARSLIYLSCPSSCSIGDGNFFQVSQK